MRNIEQNVNGRDMCTVYDSRNLAVFGDKLRRLRKKKKKKNIEKIRIRERGRKKEKDIFPKLRLTTCRDYQKVETRWFTSKTRRFVQGVASSYNERSR